ncbi:hypothetical protein AAVH_17430, partial [Aphelenchoides avenae]
LSELVQYTSTEERFPLHPGLSHEQQIIAAHEILRIDYALIHSQKNTIESVESSNNRLAGENQELRCELQQVQAKLAQAQVDLRQKNDAFSALDGRFKRLDDDYARQVHLRVAERRCQEMTHHLLCEYSQKLSTSRLEIAEAIASRNNIEN